MASTFARMASMVLGVWVLTGCDPGPSKSEVASITDQHAKNAIEIDGQKIESVRIVEKLHGETSERLLGDLTVYEPFVAYLVAVENPERYRDRAFVVEVSPIFGEATKFTPEQMELKLGEVGKWAVFRPNKPWVKVKDGGMAEPPSESEFIGSCATEWSALAKQAAGITGGDAPDSGEIVEFCECVADRNPNEHRVVTKQRIYGNMTYWFQECGLM